MRLSLSISLRYLYSPRKEGALSFLTWVAVGGIALGVAALVVAMAVMNGYQQNLVRAMSGALPHLSVHPMLAGGFEHRDALEAELRRRTGAVSISPFVMHEALLGPADPGAGAARGVIVRGIDPERDGSLQTFLSYLDDGSPGFVDLPPAERMARAQALLQRLEAPEQPRAPGNPPVPVLMSRLMADALHVELGDEVVPLMLPKSGEGFTPHRGTGRLRLAGFFNTGITSFDELVLMAPLWGLPAIFPDQPTPVALGLRLPDPLSASAVAESLRNRPPPEGEAFFVYSWLESNKGLFQVIRVQKVMLFLVLMLIVVIAFFGMISALVMMVTEKTREITILKSLGLKDRTVLEVFMSQGLFIGVVGAALGAVLGLTLCWVLQSFPVIDIPAGVYPGSDRIPIEVAPLDVVQVLGGTLLVCLVAAIFPARKAARLSPVDGLRESAAG